MTQQGKGTIDAPLGRDQPIAAQAGGAQGGPRGDHPLPGGSPLRRRGLGHHPAELRARNRPHPSNPRAYGPYRPSAGRRPALCARICDENQPPAGGPEAAVVGASAGRRCTPPNWASSTPKPARKCSFRCPAATRSCRAGNRTQPLRSGNRALKLSRLQGALRRQCGSYQRHFETYIATYSLLCAHSAIAG